MEKNFGVDAARTGRGKKRGSRPPAWQEDAGLESALRVACAIPPAGHAAFCSIALMFAIPLPRSFAPVTAPRLFTLLPLSALLLAGCTGAADIPPGGTAPGTGRLLFAEDFERDSKLAENWAVEQMPGGQVGLRDGALVIADKAGCTVWLKRKLQQPVVIRYDATMSSRGRVSDLNCFWMATDPRDPGTPPFAEKFARTGRFADYDSLRTYYVGYGGNTNSTTRFRRYTGDGTKPLLPEHDLADAPHLLQGDRTYQITIVAAQGRVRFLRDGEIVFDWVDPNPLREGWFGFRTVNSHLEIRRFRVYEPADGDLPP